MGRKTKTNDNASTAGLTDDQKQILIALQAAIALALGGAAPASDAGGEAEGDGLGGEAEGDGLGGEAEGDGLDDGLGGEPELTVDNVRDALKAVVKKLGNDKGKAKVAAILNRLGAKTLPELAEDKFQQAIDYAKKFS